MARKIVICVIFSNGRKASLNWSLELIYINYTSSCQLFFSPQSSSAFHKTRKLHWPWKKNYTCECDVFINTMLTHCNVSFMKAKMASIIL